MSDPSNELGTRAGRRRSGALRVGLIGCGKMGLQHLRAVAALEFATVVAIADPAVEGDVVPAGAEVVADAAELLERIRPDIVHIVTPPETHATLALRAIGAGCHIYVEKPFTSTAIEAAAVLAAAERAGVSVCAGHQYLYAPPFLRSCELLPTIGRLVHVESYFSFRTVRRNISPVDQVKDILPHAVYPIVGHLRLATGLQVDRIELVGVDARPTGDVYALLRLGDVTGVLLVTLSGRPVEQYQHIVGTNGWLRADCVTGGVVALPGPGAGVGVLFTPYRRALQTLTTATKGVAGLALRKTSYPGLHPLVRRFYRSILGVEAPAMTGRSILDTVDVCERVGAELDASERRSEAATADRLAAETARCAPATRGRVLVTGGTGQLGARVAAELRAAGWEVRSVSRRMPRYVQRVAGVEYQTADLARELPTTLLSGCSMVVHCAAETAGNLANHRDNSVTATERVIEAMARDGVRRLIHISSLAVLLPGGQAGGVVDESTPVDAGNMRRGPYVWGKAEAETIVRRLATAHRIDVRIIRPGPLVDFPAYIPPGRLGREVGPFYVAVGPARGALSICDVGTAAEVVRHYVEAFDTAPLLLNLVESPSPTRRELVRRLRMVRSDLWVLWVPGWFVRALSGPLKLAQRLVLGAREPLDVYSAFAGERYRTDLAAAVIAAAHSSASARAIPQSVPAEV